METSNYGTRKTDSRKSALPASTLLANSTVLLLLWTHMEEEYVYSLIQLRYPISCGLTGYQGGSIRGFLNDGTTDYKRHRNVDSLAFGHCDYSYRNLGRPSVIRLKQTNSIFEVTVDGKVCFSTNKVCEVSPKARAHIYSSPRVPFLTRYSSPCSPETPSVSRPPPRRTPTLSKSSNSKWNPSNLAHSQTPRRLNSNKSNSNSIPSPNAIQSPNKIKVSPHPSTSNSSI